MKPPPPALVESLHAAYCRAAGPRFRVALTFERRSDWRRWIAYGAKANPDGWGEPQLLAVVSYLQRRIREGRGEPESLLFSRLVGSDPKFAIEALKRFEERLLICREDYKRECGRRGRAKGPTQISTKTVDGVINRRLEASENPITEEPAPLGGLLDIFKSKIQPPRDETKRGVV